MSEKIVTKKEKLFSTEQEFLLIHEVEKRPILWDATLEVYKRADLKPALWHEIVKILGNGKFNVENTSHRWKNMKDTFNSNWNKVQESRRKCSGNGTDDMYVPKWTYYNSLLFLKKTMVAGKCVDNISITSESQNASKTDAESAMESMGMNLYYDENLQQYMLIPQESNTEESDVSPIFSTQQSPCSPVQPGPSSSPSAGTSAVLVQPGPSSAPSASAVPFTLFQAPPPRPTSAPPPRPTSAPSASSKSTRGSEEEELFQKRGASKRKSTSLMEEAVRAAKELAQPLTDIGEPQDTAQHFGMYVAGRLRDMDPASRKLCERELMDVLSKF